ncbi:MAG TPA: asparagine synthase (glutamine-hydrolyzing), partial [Polyangia bacterium]|nr:asparagine synthase (glutamine-hydrolyzing) [Polyangia bacterium]
MCGIAGFIQRQPNPEALPRMLARIVHRGPDGEGIWDRAHGGWNVAIGHRRLSIIDVEGGVQPMESADGAVVISYNGEVYNFMRLRAALEAKGRQFRTRSDTEVILQHFEQWGAGGVPSLDGMFAFAIWEARERRLTLARDRAGIKPLYYAELADGGIAFASELSALLAHGGVDRELSIEGLASYFFSDYVHPPTTIVRKVRKLPPGHTIIWQDGGFGLPHAYWQLPAPAPAPDKPDGELAAELWSDIGRAVKAQLVSDVPVGIFLSGGIDSSCVAKAAVAAGGRMKAFSIAFDDATFDESSYARTMAERLDVEWITETLHERNLLDVMDVALDHIDEPLADPSFLPTFLLSRLAARHVKVVVGGDGGDEQWGGYPTYRAHGYAATYRHIPSFIRKQVIARAVGLLPINDRYQSLEWKLRRFTKRWDDDMVTRHLRWMSSVDLPDLARAIPAAKGMQPAALAAPLPETDDSLQRILALDFTTYMPGSVLTKVDRASMAHGLEVRPPLLDDALVERAFSLPSRYKVRGGSGKFLLKLASRGKIPDEIIDRPKKGFGIPLASWLRGPLKDRIHEVVTRSPVFDRALLDGDVFRAWNQQHQAKRADHSKPLWAMLVLDHWFR